MKVGLELTVDGIMQWEEEQNFSRGKNVMVPAHFERFMTTFLL